MLGCDLTYSRVESQMTDITRDDGFFLGWSSSKGVVDYCLLNWVHLQKGNIEHRCTINTYSTQCSEITFTSFTGLTHFLKL